ncbi:lanthionine synthetase C family protein [Paraclostridium sordellii]|uniref:lanthionine synthetase C family protein n=1 Tax=Paraclostridium sordellii TaxID=1505 RepID=UPI001F051321|nr:lanthionine synthetase C family protein [Paeniclostridium sordellii]MCH1965364.1 lanthionine synthetase C family protein [Paeniclostridium sordellii]
MDKTKLNLNSKVENIDDIIYSFLEIIKDIDLVVENMKEESDIESIVNISSILLVLANSKQYLDSEVIEDIIYKYMKELNYRLNDIGPMDVSLYGGLSGIAFSIKFISDEYPYYKKTLSKLNKLIVRKTNYMIQYIKHEKEVKMSYYDIISGVSGVALYLMQFKDTYIIECVKNINKFLIDMSKIKKVYNEPILGFYISSENQFLEKEKRMYKRGTLNFGLSHGICSPLVALSLSYENGIIVENQKQTIESLLTILDKYKVEKEDCIFWNGVLSFEEYNSFDSNIYKLEPRASWCYGTPGIARSIYIGGRAIGNDRYLDLAKDSLLYLCKKQDSSEWMLDSPTICHGLSGMAVVLNLMNHEEKNDAYLTSLKILLDDILNLYNKSNKYLFKNIDEEIYGKFKYEDNLDVLTGSSGVILTLMFLRDFNIKDTFRILGVI